MQQWCKIISFQYVSPYSNNEESEERHGLRAKRCTHIKIITMVCSLQSEKQLREELCIKVESRSPQCLRAWNILNGRNHMARATNLEATLTSAGAESNPLHSQDIKNAEKCLKVTGYIVILNQQRKMLDSACEQRPQTVSIYCVFASTSDSTAEFATQMHP